MATNNPYTRSFKTKREQYEEKLKLNKKLNKIN